MICYVENYLIMKCKVRIIIKIKTKKIGLLDIGKLEELYYLGYKQAKEFFEIF